ncbi:hypothetical protein LX32DRAFT_355014 [Colletotrichum zoysiae]|uniref:Uncharacterized protein n=1 Tax=Colletotrichum zoysiae TaxID=1216348 RepID=A0AAD9M2E3_9PEZI|nr:hypothetical protein LX32DRAFT_355014 [Colletotrichum zoysiae]
MHRIFTSRPSLSRLTPPAPNSYPPNRTQTKAQERIVYLSISTRLLWWRRLVAQLWSAHLGHCYERKSIQRHSDLSILSQLVDAAGHGIVTWLSWTILPRAHPLTADISATSCSYSDLPSEYLIAKHLVLATRGMLLAISKTNSRLSVPVSVSIVAALYPSLSGARHWTLLQPFKTDPRLLDLAFGLEPPTLHR